MPRPPSRGEPITEALIAAERMRVATEVSGVGVWELDPVTGDTRWDARTREVLGAPPRGRVDQQTFERCLHPEDRERVLQEVAEAHDPAIGQYETQYRVVTSDATRWIRAKGRAFFDENGKPVRFIGIVLDISEDKAREQELRRLTAEVERRNQAKDQFIATLGHELRNPLSPISLGLQLLKDRGLDDPVLDSIGRHVRHIERLVDDLLDVSRLSHGKVRLRRRSVRLGEIVDEALESVVGSLKSRGQRVSIARRDDPVDVYVDPDRLKQVVANLVHNASKFSPMSATIEVAYGLQGELAVLEVTDPGVGIEPEMLTRLFEPFEQHEQSLDRAEGGLGLGLAVVRALVELHGGTVSATSPGPGQGTRVRVAVPKGEPSRHGTGEVARVGESSTELVATRIMLIDDNEDLCLMMSALLEGRGHTVEVAHDGTTGLDRVGVFRPDIAFIDIGLPGLDGYEVARRLRAVDRAPALVAISGYGQARDRKRSREAGFDRHLVKPIELDAMFAAIEALVHRTDGLAQR